MSFALFNLTPFYFHGLVNILKPINLTKPLLTPVIGSFKGFILVSVRDDPPTWTNPSTPKWMKT